jgi:hypothetical protein
MKYNYSSECHRLPLRVYIKTVAASATPEVLGDDSLQFHSITFSAQKAVGTDNTGNVTIQLMPAITGDWADAKILVPGTEWGYSVNPDCNDLFNAAQIRIKAATNGDGVVCILT